MLIKKVRAWIGAPAAREETGCVDEVSRGRGVRWHVVFGALLVGAVVLRLVGMAGYSSVLWTGDSIVYLRSAMTLDPSPNRPSGYGLFLWALRPFHSFNTVVLVQALMGVLTGVMVYAVVWRAALRRWRRPGWPAAVSATVAAAPVLLDGNVLELEHLLVSDALFGFLVMAAVTALLWPAWPAWWQYGLAGALLGCAAMVRLTGLPLILVVLAALALRGGSPSDEGVDAPIRSRPAMPSLLGTTVALPVMTGWAQGRFVERRRWALGACVLAGTFAIPIAAHMTWSYANRGAFSFSEHSWVWLYGRTASFADCAKITAKDPGLAVLCPKRPPTDRRVVSAVYAAMFTRDSPFRRLPGGIYGPHSNAVAKRFATTALTTQPLDYARTVIADTLMAFRPERLPYPTTWTEAQLHFPAKPSRGADTYAAARERSLARAYGGTTADQRLTDPYASWIRGYQAGWYLPGPALALLLATGLAGASVRLLRRDRDSAGVILLPWLTASALLVIPAATADFDYRYVLPTIAPACLAAALALLPDRSLKT